MAIAFVQSRSTRASAVTTLSLAYNSAVTAGNLLVCCATGFKASTFTINTPSDDNTNTWTRNRLSAYANSLRLSVSSAPNANSGITTVTVTTDVTADLALIILEYSGAATSGPFDVGNDASGSSTTVDSGNINTSGDDVVVGCMSHSGATAVIDPGVTYTQREENEDAAGQVYNVEDKIVTSGTYSANWTLAGARNYNAIVGSYRVAGDAPDQKRIYVAVMG